jgi:DNA-binding beta-propeller fold protein YncE
MGSMRSLPAPLAAALASAAALGAGCTASGDEVRAAPDQLFFPTGAAVSPDGARLFVANANSDLKFDSGTLSVVPLAAVEAVVAPWLARREVPGEVCGEGSEGGPCCAQDPDFTETLVCDERRFLGLTAQAGVRIGNFATDIAVQDLGAGALRLIVPTRGDPSITWVDYRPDEARLVCSAGGGFELCDDSHRLSFVLDDADLPLPEEPFAAYADPAGEFAMVTHLTTGSVSLIDSPRDGGARISDVELVAFEADASTGLRGATGVAGRTPQQPSNVVYVGSRTQDRVRMFTVARPQRPDPDGRRSPFLLAGGSFKLDAVGSGTTSSNGSSDTRGMAFSPTGDRLYLLNRRPPSLQIYDTSITATGVPANRAAGAVDMCRGASTLAVASSGDGERVYVTCFQDGQVLVVDPRGRGRVEDSILVGRGPFALAASPDGQRLYVTNFLEDTIAVVDLAPRSPTRNRVVLRIGRPREL